MEIRLSSVRAHRAKRVVESLDDWSRLTGSLRIPDGGLDTPTEGCFQAIRCTTGGLIVAARAHDACRLVIQRERTISAHSHFRGDKWITKRAISRQTGWGSPGRVGHVV